VNQILLESPFEQYFRELDEQSLEQERSATWHYFHSKQLFEENPHIVFNLLKKDLEFRASHQLNVLMSIEGIQGTGKSLTGLYFGILLGKIFGEPLNWENVLVDPDLLDEKLRNSKRRSTFLLDEYRHKSVGIMSQTIRFSLMDFEEQSRYTQKNIIHCAPKVYDYNHYFVIKTNKVIRKQNPKCETCPLFADCTKKFYSTLCELSFYERAGYPESFLVDLYSHRLEDFRLVVRGKMLIPMVHFETALKYDEVKNKNIRILEKGLSEAWDILKRHSDKIIEKYEENLIADKKMPSSITIKRKIFDEFGSRKFTNEAIELLIDLVKEKLKPKLPVKKK
jgi:hypothetical protein